MRTTSATSISERDEREQATSPARPASKAVFDKHCSTSFDTLKESAFQLPPPTPLRAR